MNRFLRTALALTLVLALIVAIPAATFADNHNGNQGGGHGGNQGGGHGGNQGGGHGGNQGGGHGGNQGGNHGGGSRPAPPSRPPAPPAHNPGGGFSLPHDVNARPVPVQPQRPIPVQPQSRGSRPGGTAGGTNRTSANFRRPTFNGNVSGGPYRGTFNGPAIRNPRNWQGWGWNRGTAWYPAPTYWGGGFWGAFAIGALTSAILYGSIADYQDQMIYPSYEVAPESPGAELLRNYQLQQTECGPPNLVVIWGPDNSVICAYPNNLVSPGNYELDPTTLTIVSSSQ